MNGRGQLLVIHEEVQLIEMTITRAGMTVNTKLKKKQHRIRVRVPVEETISVNLELHIFHGESNSPIRLRRL